MCRLGMELVVKIILIIATMNPLLVASDLPQVVTIDVCEGHKASLFWYFKTKEYIAVLTLRKDLVATTIATEVLPKENGTVTGFALDGRVKYSIDVKNTNIWSYSVNFTFSNITMTDKGKYNLSWINVKQVTQMRHLNVKRSVAATDKHILSTEDCQKLCSIPTDAANITITMKYKNNDGSITSSANKGQAVCDEHILQCCKTWKDVCPSTNEELCNSTLEKDCHCPAFCKPEMSFIYAIFLAITLLIFLVTLCKDTVKKGKVIVITLVIICVPPIVIIFLVYGKSDESCSGNVCINDCVIVLIAGVHIGILQVIGALVFRWRYKKALAKRSKANPLLTNEQATTTVLQSDFSMQQTTAV